jgi:uncharacterized protein
MVYLDTSALLKRYVAERRSDDFEAYFQRIAPASISRLTLLELRSGLARKRREQAIDIDHERTALTEMRIDIQDGLLRVQPALDQHLIDAFHLIDAMPDIPLRSLDAMHLAAARAAGAKELATADATMALAADKLGMQIAFFGN